MNQWDRFLFNYLAAVSSSTECSDLKSSMPKSLVVPTCPSFDCGSHANCTQLQQCYAKHDYGKYNILYSTCLSQSQYSVLGSYGFTAFFAIAGLFAGRLSDVLNRKYLITVALVFWSACVAAQGLTQNFGQVLAARLGLGFFAAFSGPASYSLIADYFDQSKRGQANGLYAFGVYVGGGLSSLSIVIDNALGWKGTSYLCGGLGLLVSLGLLFILTEPERAGASAKAKSANSYGDESLGFFAVIGKFFSDLGAALKASFSDVPVALLFLAAALRFWGGFSIGVYLPQYYKARFPDDNKLYSILNAAVVSVGGALSAYFGGYIADKWSAKDQRARAWLPALGALLGLIPFIGVVYFENFYASIACLFVEYIFAECWFGPALSIIQNRIQPEYRGTAISLFLFFANMIGNAAPIVISQFYSNKSPISDLQFSLMLSVAASYVSCACIFLVIGGLLKKNKADEKRSLLA